jgi:hypothetical protein
LRGYAHPGDGSEGGDNREFSHDHKILPMLS